MDETDLPLSPRDESILWTLTHRLRLMSVKQVARTWWKDAPAASAASRLRQLADTGLIEVIGIMAHPELDLTAPVLNWQPGDATPDFGAIAYRLKARWTDAPQLTRIVHATRAGVGMFGGFSGGRGPRPSEATHDLHLAQVYLRFQAADPRLAKRWVSEGELYADGWGRGDRLPDALIHGHRANQLTRIVEFGGAYAKAKLADFHRAFSKFNYEVW